MKKIYILLILLLISSLIFTGCNKKNIERPQTIPTNPIDLTEEIEEEISQTQATYDSLILEIENCSDDNKAQRLKLFFKGLENDGTINNCDMLIEKIYNNGNGQVININEVINNGLISNEKELKEIDVNTFNTKIICDVEIKKCSISE